MLGLLLYQSTISPDHVRLIEPEYHERHYYVQVDLGDAIPSKKPVWIVFEGTTVYIDRNGNHDLTEPNEKFTGKVIMWGISKVPPEGYLPGVMFKIPDTDKDLASLTVQLGSFGYYPGPRYASFSCQRNGLTLAAGVHLGDTIEEANCAVFHGPLQLLTNDKKLSKSKDNWPGFFLGIPGSKGVAGCYLEQPKGMYGELVLRYKTPAGNIIKEVHKLATPS